MATTASKTASASSSAPQMEVNPRGIPRAPFVVRSVPSDVATRQETDIQANVEEYVGGPHGEIEGVMKTFQETSA